MKKVRIMVVDDESIIRMDLKEMLLESGYDVIAEANSGDAAIELAAKHRPDLIIMDVKMPGMSGIKASRIIQQSFGIPVMLLTAYSRDELIEEAKNSSVVGYLVKPISKRSLIPAIEIALANLQRFETMNSKNKELVNQIENQKKIQQAKGILMERYHLSEDEAYRQLQLYSMTNHKKMKEVAEYVIVHKNLPS